MYANESTITMSAFIELTRFSQGRFTHLPMVALSLDNRIRKTMQAGSSVAAVTWTKIIIVISVDGLAISTTTPAVASIRN